jgi:hypothetical protein
MCWSEGVRLQLSVLSSLRLKLHSDYLGTALQCRARTKWLGLGCDANRRCRFLGAQPASPKAASFEVIAWLLERQRRQARRSSI